MVVRRQPFIFKKLCKDPFSSPQSFVSFLSRFLRKISALVTMELLNAKVVGGASVALLLSNRRKENSL